MNIKNQKGVAMVVTLFFTTILFGLAGIFIIRVYNESNMARIERQNTQTFYTAHGAMNLALKQMDTLINSYLNDTISSASPSGVISYATSKVNSGDGIGWLLNAVRDTNNNPVLTQNGEQAEYAANGTLNNIPYSYMIIMTEQQDPVDTGAESWDFSYSYNIEATSTVNGVTSRIQMNGDFTVNLQRDNFAKFALFTNNQTTPSGSNVYFTDKTNFAGPVHTNGRFNFALNPSGTFEAAVSQFEQTARFHNGGWPVLLDDDNNGTTDVPTFHDAFTRNAGTIALNAGTSEQDMVDQATGGQSFVSNGIYVPYSGASLAGGIYVKGDSNVTMTVNGSNPVYTITQGSASKTITLNLSGNQTTVLDNVAGTSQTYNGLPDGTDDVGAVIYVEGAINNFSGTVQQDSKVTVASSNDIVINNNVKYQNYTPAVGTPGSAGYVPPHANGTDNMLGIVSWGGSVRIGASAPNNVEVHGSILASSGVYTVDNYNSGSPRGTSTLLGGVISDDYGAFGTFNSGTGQQVSGYGRNFVYDERMEQGQAPPYFPSLSTFIAFTDDLTDELIWQEGE